jgi:hypothetical protein
MRSAISRESQVLVRSALGFLLIEFVSYRTRMLWHQSGYTRAGEEAALGDGMQHVIFGQMSLDRETGTFPSTGSNVDMGLQ